MHRFGQIWLIFIVCTINWTVSLPTKDATTHRSQFGQTIKEVSNQLLNVNDTSKDMTFDTRTPPKVKQQMAKKESQTLENSHPGVAVPVEDEELILEEGSKKFNFYKIDRSTTDGGISTWVLLNSQTVAPVTATTKTPRKTTQKPKFEIRNITTTIESEIISKVTKPPSKKRLTTTTTTAQPPITNKNLTIIVKEKIKPKIAGLNITSSKNKSESSELIQQYLEATANLTKNTSFLEDEEVTENIQEPVNVIISLSDNEPELINPEAKEGEIDLQVSTETTTKKTRKSSQKKKKNKKRRKPSIEKSDDVTDLIVNSLTQKEKPIGTQIYNYLSREIMPTVGVGLVGLVVTAGLASYFLYPFGVARRSYEVVDRKDKDVSYYYNDDYTPGGVAEEEVIGKVIAGMPTHSKSYRSQNHQKTIYNPIHQQTAKPINYEVNYKSAQPQATVEAVYLTPDQKYNTDDISIYGSPQRNNKPFYEQSQSYQKDMLEYIPEKGYKVEDKKFVVGNTPKPMIEEVTPVVVPEHGPRNFNEAVTKDSLDSISNIIPKSLSDAFLEHEPRTLTRKRRSKDVENEILSPDEVSQKLKEKNEEVVSSTIPSETESETPISIYSEPSFINTLRELLHLKIRIGLELLQNTTQAISRYLSVVQSRLNKINAEEHNSKNK